MSWLSDFFSAQTILAVCVGCTISTAGPVGMIRVIDGDMLDVGDTRVRLQGIDAPEQAQTCTTQQGAEWRCGAWVSQTVQDRYAGEVATCATVDIDRFDRVVARCLVNGQDIAETLVSDGLAFAYERYSYSYVAAERAAAAQSNGLHASRIVPPSDFRRTRAQSAPAPDGACRIKGNISSSGTRIYHLPGQKHYEKTRISVQKGERWFCSAAQARAAGWRAARR